MSDIYANIPVPPSTGNYPERYVFSTPGQSVEGIVRDVRMSTGGQYEPCPILDIQTTQIGPDGQPVCWSVFCNPTSLWRQLTSLKPPVGSMVRVTFTGYEGQAKLFQLDVAPGPGAAPAPQFQAPPQPQPQAQGFPPQEAYAPQPQPQPQPTGFAPTPAPGATPPWGAPPPAA